jgi:hypothetical protein
MAKSNVLKCECCGRAYPKAKVVTAEVVDKSTMTDAQLFAYCKRVAVLGDAEFFARYGNVQPPDVAPLETLIAELRVRKSTAADISLLWRMKQDARSNPAHWTKVQPATVNVAA